MGGTYQYVYDKLHPQTDVGETTHYADRIGMRRGFRGAGFRYLVLIQDFGYDGRTGVSTFSNFSINEIDLPDVLVDVYGSTVALNLITQESYVGAQDRDPTHLLDVSPDGRSVTTRGNIYRAIEFPDGPVDILKSTDLSFDFYLEERAEIHAICLADEMGPGQYDEPEVPPGGGNPEHVLRARSKDGGGEGESLSLPRGEEVYGGGELPGLHPGYRHQQ